MSHTAPSVPGPRPHPSLISFAPECFVTDGTREEYSVLNPFGRGGPEKFGTDLAAATKHALRCGREVETHVAPVLRRVRAVIAAAALARRDAATAHVAATRNAAQRKALRAEARASEAAADWTNLLTMLEQPGRPVAAAIVRKLARAARVSKADLAAVLAHAQVSQ